MAREVEQRAIVDDVAGLGLADPYAGLRLAEKTLNDGVARKFPAGSITHRRRFVIP